MERERLDRSAWRKSSYSGSDGGNCTQVATAHGAVLVRDSKDPEGARLAFNAETWRAFAVKVKRSLASDRWPRVGRCL